MPYYIGDVIRDEKRLIARTPEKFRETGIDVRIETRVEEIDPQQRVVRPSGGAAIPYDILVLGTGTRALLPGIPGEELDGVFTLHKLTDAIQMKAYIREKQCRKAVVVGAGFISMEMCEVLRGIGLETKVVYRGPRPVKKWDPEFSKLILEKLDRHQVSMLTNTETIAIEKGENSRLRLITNQGEVETDLILLALGLKPNTELAEDMGLQLGKTGAIQVDSSQRTSGEGIYAVGDCCEVYHRISRRWIHLPLGDIANKQGRVAGRNIGGIPMAFPGVVGAQSFKIFDMEVAATGLDEREATASGYQAVSTIIWGNAIAGPLPEAKKLGIKLVADRSSGKLLGAQAVGEMGAVSRINTLSCALWAGMDLDEIAYLDLAYSPFFGGAWDVIHTAAQALKKQL
jgi:NADPH-dependent 2,4-dienoyl-CoA reductase/sulfur reductase-like enzyme